MAGLDGTKRPKRGKPETTPTSTAALRAQAVQYFRLGWSDEQIGQLFKRSAGTVRHWRSHPDVKAALRGITEHVEEATKEQAVDIAEKAWRKLGKLIDSDDERIALDAVKTTLSRKGHPETSKSESKNEHTVDVPTDRDELERRLERGLARLRAKNGDEG